MTNTIASKFALAAATAAVLGMTAVAPANAATADIDARVQSINVLKAERRADLGVIVERAKDMGVSVKTLANMDRINAEKAERRVQLAAHIDRANDKGIAVKTMANVDRINAEKAQRRVEIAEFVNRAKVQGVTVKALADMEVTGNALATKPVVEHGSDIDG